MTSATAIVVAMTLVLAAPAAAEAPAPGTRIEIDGIHPTLREGVFRVLTTVQAAANDEPRQVAVRLEILGGSEPRPPAYRVIRLRPGLRQTVAFMTMLAPDSTRAGTVTLRATVVDTPRLLRAEASAERTLPISESMHPK